MLLSQREKRMDEQINISQPLPVLFILTSAFQAQLYGKQSTHFPLPLLPGGIVLLYFHEKAPH